MPNEEEEQTPESERGLGFSHLAMNEIAASKTEEPSEVARRTSARWLWIIVVVAVVGAGAWLLRSALNLPPPTQVQQQFEQSPVMVNAVQQGWVHRVTFVSGSTVRLDLSPNIRTADDESRKQLRRLTTQIMEALVAARPGRDLEIIGFQNNEQMLQASYRFRTVLVDQGGQPALDIVTHIKGDPKGGITAAMPAQAATGR